MKLLKFRNDMNARAVLNNSIVTIKDILKQWQQLLLMLKHEL